MTARWRGWLLAGIHLALVLSIALKYEVDRRTLPRVWVRSAPYDPYLPIRGRYVSLQVEVQVDPSFLTEAAGPDPFRYNIEAKPARLVVEGSELHLKRDPEGGSLWIAREDRSDPPRYRLQRALAYFIPEHVDDPSRRAPGDDLWVEVSVPRRGMPRPIRLGTKHDGKLVPLTPR